MELKTSDSLNISEKGRAEGGRAISSDRRLFMQLLAFGSCFDVNPLIQALVEAEIAGVLYEDINDPLGVALLSASETPDFFISNLRKILNSQPFSELHIKHEYTMLGRTYSLGHETDLDEVLVRRPLQRMLDPKFPWAIWYPLRRSASFEQLPAKEQKVILMEHAGVGRVFGKAGYGVDIRLACHGLDKNDNDFVIGLLGAELYPLSALVQRMRKTKQTALHLESLGPFFIGKAVWQKNVK